MKPQASDNDVATSGFESKMDPMFTKVALPKRCKFYVACGLSARLWRWHTFLKRWVAVCEHCANTNEYLVSQKE
jgi:hypothetical protein